MRRAAAALGALLLAACHALPGPQRREQLEALLAEAVVPVVFDPAAELAFVRVAEAFAPSAGLREGERLRAEVELPPPARGFAEAFVAALREQPRFASTPFAPRELGAARELLLARGAAPVFFASASSWRLYYDLSLRRYRMGVRVHVDVAPAAEVAAGRGAMATPEPLWRGECTFHGPDPPLPIEAWRADRGALLHHIVRDAQERCGRRVADLLLAFLERGEEPDGVAQAARAAAAGSAVRIR